MADDVSEEEKAARIVELQARQRYIQSAAHARLVGVTIEVLVDAVSRRRDAELSGRTSGNTVVNFPVPADIDHNGPATLIGRTLSVRITRAGPNSVSGVVVQA